MKKIIPLVIVMIIVLLSACAIVEPPIANQYTEKEDATNDTEAETTTFTLGPDQEYRVIGEFEDANDADTFFVPIASGLSVVDFRTAHNGEEVTSDLILNINTFPLTVTFWDAEGDSVGSIYINAASDGSTVEIPSTAVNMKLYIYAVSETLLGSPLPYTSGDYFVQFSAY